MLAEVVAPLADPAFDEALIALGLLLGACVLLGILYALDYFCRAVFGSLKGSVSWIPWAGKILTSPLVKAEDKVNTILGQGEAKMDTAIGRYFHAVARLIVNLAEQIKRHAYLLLAFSFLGLTGAVAEWIREHFHWIRKQIDSIVGQQHVTAKAATVTLPKTQTADRAGAASAVKSLSATVAQATTVDIPGLRARDQAIADQVAKLAQAIRAKARHLPIGLVAAVGLWAIAKVGGSWIRCTNWRRIGRVGCNMPLRFLEDLLALATDYFILTNVCEVFGWLEAGYAEVEPWLTGLITDATKGVCHGGKFREEKLPALTLLTPATSGDEPVEWTRPQDVAAAIATAKLAVQAAEAAV